MATTGLFIVVAVGCFVLTQGIKTRLSNVPKNEELLPINHVNDYISGSGEADDGITSLPNIEVTETVIAHDTKGNGNDVLRETSSTQKKDVPLFLIIAPVSVVVVFLAVIILVTVLLRRRNLKKASLSQGDGPLRTVNNLYCDISYRINSETHLSQDSPDLKTA